MKQLWVSVARKAVPIGKVLLVIVLALGLIHGIATFILGRKVEAEINALRARGEWVTIIEAVGPKVPDSENGALLYTTAFKRLKGKNVERDLKLFRDIRDGKLDKQGPEAWDRARRTLAKYDNVMATISKAAGYKRYSFPVDWGKGLNGDISHVVGLRDASLLCDADAIIKARDGKTEQAIRSIEICMKLSNAVRDESLALSQIIRGICVQNACIAIDRTLDRSRLSDDQARRLADELAAFDVREGYDRSIKGEMALMLWISKYMQDHRISVADVVGNSDLKLNLAQKLFLWSTGRYVSRPLIYAEQLAFLRGRNKLMEVASLDRREPADGKELAGCGVFSSLWPRFVNMYRGRTYDIMATMAETRTALGLHVYKDQHGSYPSSLDELRAGAKWQVPTDPYTGEELIYKRQANGFALYSVGPNGKDDGGKAKTDDIVRGAKAS